MKMRIFGGKSYKVQSFLFAKKLKLEFGIVIKQYDNMCCKQLPNVFKNFFLKKFKTSTNIYKMNANVWKVTKFPCFV